MNKINGADFVPYRMREFYQPVENRRNVILDLSAGLTRGALPGLEDFNQAAASVTELVDGIIVSPGQRRRLTNSTRSNAAVLIKADWTNALRPSDFPLPPETIQYLPIINPDDGLDLGASALVTTFLLGFEEEIEAACLRNTVQMALNSRSLGIPLLVDIHPAGPRVVLLNQAIALGASYALEGGADGIAIPWPGQETLKNILTMAAGIPVWVKLLAHRQPLTEAGIEEAIRRTADLAVAGFWLNESIFSVNTSAMLAKLTKSQVIKQGEP